MQLSHFIYDLISSLNNYQFCINKNRIGHLEQENKISMSKPESIYMWDNVDKTIQIIESRIDLINRRTDLYEPKYCSQDNEGCLLK